MEGEAKSTGRVEQVVLIVADISNYTQFMLASREALVHGQQIVRELLEAIITEIEIPLKIKEIEGDALFLYAIRSEDESWNETRQLLGSRLLAFFRAFRGALVEAADASICPCDICDNLEKLRLKIVVHSGEAAIAEVDRFPHLYGADVVLVHRLLKNSVPSDEYVLTTTAGLRDIDLGTGRDWIECPQQVDGFGEVNAFVHVFDETDRDRVRDSYRQLPALARFQRGLSWLRKGYFGQFPILLRLGPQETPLEPAHRELGGARSVLFALGLVVFGPLLLLGGAAAIAWRSWRGPVRANRSLAAGPETDR